MFTENVKKHKSSLSERWQETSWTKGIMSLIQTELN